MADTDHEVPAGDHLPGINSVMGWVKIVAVLFAMILLNAMVAITTWGWGVMISIPFTAFLFFLLLRDMIPRHRFPRGRFPPGRQPPGPRTA